MTYADAYNLRATNLNYNNVADAIDGVLSRPWGGTSAGTSTAYTVTCSPAWTAYESGRILAFTPHTDGGATVTINVNSLGAKTIKYKNQNLIGGELVSGVEAVLSYDGTNFELLNHGGGWYTGWTPTYTGSGSMTFGTVTTVSKVQRHGLRIDYILNASGTIGGTVSNELRFSPFLAPGHSNGGFGFGDVVDSGASKGCFLQGGNPFGVRKYDGSNFVLGAGIIQVSGFYYV